MIINLIEVWSNSLISKKQEREVYQQKLKEENTNYIPTIDDKYIQSSFYFDDKNLPQDKMLPSLYDEVRVIFIDSISNLNLVRYDSLATVEMTQDEVESVERKKIELKKNPKFYDGDNMMIKGIYFDTQNNIVYVEAVRIKYSFLCTLQSKAFPKNSALNDLQLYKTGVIAPFITQDEAVCLMERNDQFKLFSAASGFLNPVGPKNSLNPFWDYSWKFDEVPDFIFQRPYDDIVIETAKQEALEEFLGDEMGKSRITFDKPKLVSISFREIEGGVGTIEFIAPIKLHCHAPRLQGVISSNVAQDKHEHTGNFQLIPLKADERDKLDFFKTKKPGNFLYEPLLLACTKLINSDYYNYKDTQPTHLPDSRTHSVSINDLTPQLGWLYKNQSKFNGSFNVAENCSLNDPDLNKGNSNTIQKMKIIQAL